ncbi:MAG TPA: hypothetical protein VEC99_17900, partial [Clostridia bacterium]|nr:hypothetical protein [Clostridia bacterium]
MKCRETLLCILLFWSASCLAQKEALEEVKRLELEGRFQEAAGVLTRALDAAPAASELHQAFEFGLERLDRIRKDFPYSKEKLFAELAKSVKDLTSQEYERWIRAGRFESRTIDGQQRFALASVSNLFFRYPELNARRVPPKDTAALERLHWETCVAIKSAAAAQKKSYVLPKRFVATMTVLANANVAPPGEIIRAWLPIPRDYPFQREFELISTTPRSRHLDTEASSIRNVYLEQPTREDQPTEFKVEYAYTRYG